MWAQSVSIIQVPIERYMPDNQESGKREYDSNHWNEFWLLAFFTEQGKFQENHGKIKSEHIRARSRNPRHANATSDKRSMS